MITSLHWDQSDCMALIKCLPLYSFRTITSWLTFYTFLISTPVFVLFVYKQCQGFARAAIVIIQFGVIGRLRPIWKHRSNRHLMIWAHPLDTYIQGTIDVIYYVPQLNKNAVHCIVIQIYINWNDHSCRSFKHGVELDCCSMVFITVGPMYCPIWPPMMLYCPPLIHNTWNAILY